MAQPDFADPHMSNGTRGRSETINEENTDARQGQKSFSRPLLNQLRWHHGEGCEWFAVTVHVDSAEGDQCLASPTLRDYRRTACLIPTLHYTHDRECLCRERLAEHLPDERRRCVVKALQRRIGLKNPLTQLGGPRTQILVDVLRQWHGFVLMGWSVDSEK